MDPKTSKEEKLKKIAQRMLDWLDTQPSGIELASVDVLVKACGAEFDGVKYIGNFILDDGTVIDDREEFDVDEIFKALAVERGYIIDGMASWGFCVGIPPNIPHIYYKIDDLLSSLKESDSVDLFPEGGKGISIKEIIRQVTPFNGIRLFQLLTVPAGMSTGKFDAKAMKTIVNVIKGKGVSHHSGNFPRFYHLTTDVSESIVEDFIDEHKGISYYVGDRIVEGDGPYWFEITNNGDKDLQLLFIREVNTWPRVYVSS